MVSQLIHARGATNLEMAALPVISGSTVVLAKAALADLGPVTLTTILSANPVVTAILAWIFLGTRLSALQLCAMLIVVVSAITMQLARATPPRE